MFKKFRFLFIAVITLALISTQLQAKPYHNAKEGFALALPDAWEVKEDFYNTAVMSLSQPEGPADNFRENINVVVEPLPNAGYTAQQYYDANLVSMKNVLKQFAVLETKTVTLPKEGTPAVVMVAEHNMGDGKVKSMAWFFTRGPKGYVITGTALPTTFDKHRAEFEKIADSFALAQ